MNTQSQGTLPLSKRNHLRTEDISHLTSFMNEAGISPPELSTQLGMSVTAVYNWVTKKSAPAWTVHAIKGLRSEMGQEEREVFICHPSYGDQQNALEFFLTATGISFTKLNL